MSGGRARSPWMVLAPGSGTGDGPRVGVKDNIDVAGLPTTNGLGAETARVADEDAVVVHRLRERGARILGKLAMDEAALGATGDNPHHGPVDNPWRAGFSAGGSSSGAGAAVAADLADLALGTDTLGSVRIPAAYCGVVGLKPTTGALSAVGVAPLAASLDTVGPLVARAAELRDALDALAEPEAPLEPHGRDRHGLGGLSIAVPSSLAQLAIDPEVRDAFERALAILTELGADVREMEIEAFGGSDVRRAGLLLVEAEAAAAHAHALASHPKAYSPGLRAMLDFGRSADEARLARARTTVEAAAGALTRTLAEVDLVATPTTPQTAFARKLPAPASQADLTAPASFAGCPALSVPCALSGSGLPVGLQLIGRRWQDRLLVVVAACFEQACGLDLPALRTSRAPT